MLLLLLSMADTMDKKEKIMYIYDQYRSLMAYTADKYLSKDSKTEAEDIVQEAMVDIIEYIDNIDIEDELAVKSICVLFAKRRAIDSFRLKENRVLPIEEIFTAQPTDEGIPDGQLFAKELEKQLAVAISELDDNYRNACRLKIINGLKIKDISKILGLTPRVTSMRILRGKKILQEKLRKEGYDG